MRTTIRIDEHLLREAKEFAARTGRSLTSVIEDALRESLSRKDRQVQREWVHLTTFGGNGLRPGVDLDDSASLLDLMESRDDPD